MPATSNQGSITNSSSTTSHPAKEARGFTKYRGDLNSGNARNVVVADPLITKRYIRQIENITQKAVTNQQISLLKNALKTQEFKKLDEVQKKAHRDKFNGIKDKLIVEWEKKTDKKWPKYTENIFSSKGKNFKKKRYVL